MSETQTPEPTPSAGMDKGLHKLEVTTGSEVASMFDERDRLRDEAAATPSLHNDADHRKRMLELNSQLSGVDASMAPKTPDTKTESSQTDIGGAAYAMGDSSYLIPKIEGASTGSASTEPNKPVSGPEDDGTSDTTSVPGSTDGGDGEPGTPNSSDPAEMVKESVRQAHEAHRQAGVDNGNNVRDFQERQNNDGDPAGPVSDSVRQANDAHRQAGVDYGNNVRDFQSRQREGGPELPPPPDTTPTPEAAKEALAALRDELNAATTRLAKAKDRNDSIFSKFHRKAKNESGLNDQGELQAASDHLKDVFARYTRGLAGVVVAESRPLDGEITDIRAKVAAGDLSPEEGQRLTARMAELMTQKQALAIDALGTITQEMMAARYKVDQEQLALKKGKFMGKFRELWTKHPAARAGISFGLMAAGAVGTATGIAPLAVGSFALRRSLGTVGTYVGVEGGLRKGAEVLGERKAKKEGEAKIAGLTPNEAGWAEGLANDIVDRPQAAGAEVLSDEQKAEHRRFIQENYKELFRDEPDSLISILRGSEADPSKVVNSLLEDKLERLRVESDRTRRSKYVALVGAAVVGAVSAEHIMNTKDTVPVTDTPRPGGGPSETDLNNAFFKGIEQKHGPSAAADWEHLKKMGDSNAKALWDSNPDHDQIAKAFDGGKWMNELKDLSPEDQLRAAKKIGIQFDSHGTKALSPESLQDIVEYYK